MKTGRFNKDNRSIKNGLGYAYINTTREADSKNTNWFCPTHKITVRSRMLEDVPLCSICREPMIDLGNRTRMPKKTASKWIWKNFLNLFKNRIKK